MKLRHAPLVAALITLGVIGSVPAARAADPQPVKPGISEDARAALQDMSKTLLSKDFSFTARTLRVYADENGDMLHVGHSLKVVVRRPDGLSVKATGDDGSSELIYDGKTVALVDINDKKYSVVPAPHTLPAMFQDVMGRLNVDFPLADFLTDDPGKMFLSGVNAGREINTVTIDGTPCRHFFFTQTGGIELELWLEKNDRALPRRLIATYRLLPGQPSFVAEFSDWHFGIRPSDAEFVFQPPAGATKVELKQVGFGSEAGDK